MSAESYGSFTCEVCKGTFDSDWSDEEALAEATEFFGSEATKDPEDLATVCDDCYKRLIRSLTN